MVSLSNHALPGYLDHRRRDTHRLHHAPQVLINGCHLFNGAPCQIDHHWDMPSLKHAAGSFADAAYDAGAIRATLSLWDTRAETCWNACSTLGCRTAQPAPRSPMSVCPPFCGAISMYGRIAIRPYESLPLSAWSNPWTPCSSCRGRQGRARLKLAFAHFANKYRRSFRVRSANQPNHLPRPGKPAPVQEPPAPQTSPWLTPWPQSHASPIASNHSPRT